MPVGPFSLVFKAPVVKTHGSSDAKAGVYSTIRQDPNHAETDVVGKSVVEFSKEVDKAE